MGTIPIPSSHYKGKNYLQSRLTNPTGEITSVFGAKVSISGDYAIISSLLENLTSVDQGQAYIYFRTGTTWNLQATLPCPVAENATQFGFSVDIDGDYAIVGAHGVNGAGADSGQAYIYFRTGTTWNLQATFINPTADPNASLGYQVSISGDYALVSAYGENDPNPSSGVVYIYHRSGTTWPLEATLHNPTGEASSFFGYAAAISGDYALVGAFSENVTNADQGQAYVFFRTGTTWNLQATLVNPTAETGSSFGNFLDISGDYALVSASTEDDPAPNTGISYIFHRSGVTWPLEATLRNPTGEANSNFGEQIFIHGNYIGVGRTGNDIPALDSGLAYLFHKDGTNWPLKYTITNPTNEASSYFGIGISMSGQYLFISAYGEDDPGAEVGKAYIYKISEP